MWSVLLCLCLFVSMSSLYGREVTVGYARLRGGMGATFCHLAALRSAIEFLFLGLLGNDRFGQILAGRSRKVTGANFCHLAALRPPIEFLFWDHWETAVLGQILAGRSREVTEGHGKLRVTEGENGGKWRNGRKRVGENQRKCLKCRVWSGKCSVYIYIYRV